MSKAKQTPNYQELKDELDKILEDLQREDLDVDAALKDYQRGLELVRQLEAYLASAENTVKELKASLPPQA
ncbi:MAG TPA: exodeoxyribonuclease VII small subunit [Candidatus Saccharimonadales bacterium]|nr:exodeoxyribonuclease VII small subunit [Candidatus Saccharimonadales bacterium]